MRETSRVEHLQSAIALEASWNMHIYAYDFLLNIIFYLSSFTSLFFDSLRLSFVLYSVSQGRRTIAS